MASPLFVLLWNALVAYLVISFLSSADGEYLTWRKGAAGAAS
jgi:hypothetical protein